MAPLSAPHRQPPGRQPLGLQGRIASQKGPFRNAERPFLHPETAHAATPYGIYGRAAYLMSGNRTATARRPLASPLTDGRPCPHGINDARTQQRSRMGAAGHAPLRNSPATAIRPSICHNRLTLLRPARPCGACATRDKRAKAPLRQVWRMPHRLLSRWHRPTWGRTSARRCGGRA